MDDTLHDVAEAIEDLRTRVSDVAAAISAAYEVIDEDDTDGLKLYEANEIVSTLMVPLADARDKVATYIGLKALAERVS